jgi:hypothetical protein
LSGRGAKHASGSRRELAMMACVQNGWKQRCFVCCIRRTTRAQVEAARGKPPKIPMTLVMDAGAGGSGGGIEPRGCDASKETPGSRRPNARSPTTRPVCPFHSSFLKSRSIPIYSGPCSRFWSLLCLLFGLPLVSSYSPQLGKYKWEGSDIFRFIAWVGRFLVLLTI